MTTRKIEIGALCPPLTEQLKGIIPAKDARYFERYRKGLILIYVAGILKDTEFDKAAKRLLVKILKAQSSKA